MNLHSRVLLTINGIGLGSSLEKLSNSSHRIWMRFNDIHFHLIFLVDGTIMGNAGSSTLLPEELSLLDSFCQDQPWPFDSEKWLNLFNFKVSLELLKSDVMTKEFSGYCKQLGSFFISSILLKYRRYQIDNYFTSFFPLFYHYSFE